MKPYWRSEHSSLPSLTLTNGLSQSRVTSLANNVAG